MKLAIHNTVGKVPGPHLGKDWMTVDITWDDAFELITVDGLATTAELKSDHRTTDQFVSRQLLMVDIDKGMSFEDLFNNSFYNEFGAGYYTTPSHVDITKPRFRILFRTEEAIILPDAYVQIYRGLLQLFQSADPACKDPTRLFFGTPNAPYKEQRSNILSLEMMNTLFQMMNIYDDEQKDFHSIDNVIHRELDDAYKQKILDLLKKTYLGEYEQWIRVGFGLKNSGFNLSDFQFVTQGMMSEKSSKDAKAVWDGANRTGVVCTIGTIIHLLKARHGEDCLHILPIKVDLIRDRSKAINRLRGE